METYQKRAGVAKLLLNKICQDKNFIGIEESFH